MNYSKKDLIIFALFILSFYLHFFKKETFANVKLDKDAKGNFVIPGNLKVNGTIGVRREPDPKIGVLVNGSGLGGAIQSNGTLYVYGQSHLMGNVGVKRDPHPKVGLIVNAQSLKIGMETVGAGIYCDKTLQVTGDSILQNITSKGEPITGGSNADTEAIRNLSKLANDLTKNGKLVVPGGLEIKGNLKVGGNVGVRRDPHPKVGLIVNAAGLLVGVETQGAGVYADKSLRVQGNTRLNGNVGVRREAHPKVGLIVDAAGLSQGVETVSAGIYCDKNLIVTGTSKLNGNVGVRREPHPKIGLYVNGSGLTVGMETNTRIHTRDLMATRYIGARDEIASTAGLYAKCSSVNDNGYGSSCRKSMK